MGEDQPSPSSFRSKRQRSSVDATDDDPKRRKSHHHRHHHRHRHQSKHGRFRDEEEDLANFTDKKLNHASMVKPVDYEREEGEILEEEEEEGGREGPGLAMEADSEVESGEIKTDPVSPVLTKELSCEEDLLQEHQLDNLNAEKSIVILNCRGKENDSSKCHLFDKILDTSNNTGEFGDLAGGESRKKSKPFIKSAEKDDHRIIDLNDLGHKEGSITPVSKESSYWLKHADKDDHLNRYSDCTSMKVKSKQKLEQEEDERRGSSNNNRSLSPRSSKERCIEAAQSSSCEVGNKDLSVSDGHTSGRLYEQLQETDADESVQMIRSERWIRERNNSDHERSSRYGSLEKYKSRSQAVDKGNYKEREGSFYGKHDVHDYRHSSQDRAKERVDRRHGSQDRGNEVERRSSGYRDMDSKKSHSSNRYDEREHKHDRLYKEGDRDRGSKTYSRRDREREREREERERDKSRDRYKESERIRNVKGERERDGDGTERETIRIRDKKTNSHSDRERVDERDRYRRSNHDRPRDSRQSKHEDTEYRKERTRVKTATINSHYFEEEKQNSLREEDEEYQGRIEQQLAKQDEEDIEKIKEESRKRRQAILEKYKQQENQNLKPQPNAHEKEELFSMEKDGMQQVSQKFNGVNKTEKPVEQHDLSDALVVDPSFIVGKSPVQNGLSVPENTGATCALGEGSPKSERSTDMFCDDIFGESPAGVRKVGKDDFMKIDGNGLHDNWDDAEGYYSYRLGEVLDGRYEVIAAHGKGVFSTVVRAKDLKAGKSDPEEVAIKIIRSNDTMYKAGMEELVILKKLAGADPEDKRHCVRFLSSFKYRNHLCLVFESLHMNLREVLKKFGRNIGLRLTAVRAYAKQLFIALKHLRNCGVLHCDIKPDNMLVNEAKNVLKLCDFGNAMFAGKNDITPYLVSRFYRAPEIILGLSYDHPLDIWSVGCCLFELYTGKVLFPGPSNNDMLRLHMELKGPFPKKMLRKGAFIDQHFDQDLNFHATEDDPVTKKTVKRLLLNIKPKDIGTLISGSTGEDPKMLLNFKDLLERVFALDPEKRMTVSQALSHPFITGK
ncbi:serine/threonine-protein kinase prpf4B isoform X2 [Dendrobium catenatum]|uniref:Serine/threonine-protein kinase PRP4 homolog n=1 Tax=Dendrobium catenatum TaxID=906689 RepID=A0A2I0WAP8_9ASPA|nr:serine/threonine-protein kinase prpf4B isoform X2 [Dendrobium catenatum]XP_020684403.1 serine/threonine-protein kinase prpf4B isoform X2 [Dendrobium catenatum]XP_020684426.1 serine/threonine-protein kinase prpf4B isoform X2 [Dendrobium catenatum]PKU72737.1 Serine/threonine-protein kinase AFC3 [Dendrobium catenatum]